MKNESSRAARMSRRGFPTRTDQMVDMKLKRCECGSLSVTGTGIPGTDKRLLHAAPYLYSALTRLLEAYEADKKRGLAFGNDQAADQARAALAKVSAESSGSHQEVR